MLMFADHQRVSLWVRIFHAVKRAFVSDAVIKHVSLNELIVFGPSIQSLMMMVRLGRLTFVPDWLLTHGSEFVEERRLLALRCFPRTLK